MDKQAKIAKKNSFASIIFKNFRSKNPDKKLKF